MPDACQVERVLGWSLSSLILSTKNTLNQQHLLL